MRKVSVVLLLLVAAQFCGQCSDSSEPAPPASENYRTPAQLTQTEQGLVQSTNQFAFEMFRRVNQNAPSGQNVFISPLSISIALGLMANGADGATRDEMLDVLELQGMSMTAADSAYRDLAAILMHADPAVTFNIANSFWSRTGLAVQPDFVTVCRDYFDARVEEIDFAAPGSADIINGWVSDNTNGRIKEIIEPRISVDLAALLLNALYFKGSWTFPFDTADTRTRTFYLADGDSVMCHMMSKDTRKEAQLYPAAFSSRLPSFAQNELCRLADLPYGSTGYRMCVLLPEGSLTADSLIGLLTSSTWETWRASLQTQRFYLWLPRFKFEFGAGLNDILKAMGMPSAFDPGLADLSNLFAGGGRWISEVKHKTFVQVDEKGTEAAAVTSVGVFTLAPPDIRLNRPFVFVIHEIESGAILFMGKVEDPTKES